MNNYAHYMPKSQHLKRIQSRAHRAVSISRASVPMCPDMSADYVFGRRLSRMDDETMAEWLILSRKIAVD